MQSVKQYRVCRECKWFRLEHTHAYIGKIERIEKGKCTHPHFKVVDMVTGVETFPPAMNIRKALRHEKDDGNTVCGLEGALWQSETAYNMFIRELLWPTPAQIYAYVVSFVIFAIYITTLSQAQTATN